MTPNVGKTGDDTQHWKNWIRHLMLAKLEMTPNIGKTGDDT